MAEKPERIRKLFLTQDVNQYGVYSIMLIKNGQVREVVIDDKIPVHYDELVFSRSHGPELWVMLLEKAWAKVHGCYHNIARGSTVSTLADLTGAPAYSSNIAEESGDIFNIIKQGLENGWPMCAGYSVEDPDQQKLRLLPKHSYAITRV